MGAVPAKRRTITRSSISPKKSATAANYGEGENDVASNVMIFRFLTSLKAGAEKKDLNQVSRIHANIRHSGLLEQNTYLANTVVSMYVKCGALVRAQEVVDELPVRNVVSWNTLIAGYVQQGQGKEALCCFHRLRCEGLSPDAITYACILKACGTTHEAEMGEHLHGEIISQGLLEKDVVLGSALVDMYAKCGTFWKAQKVLDDLPVRNVVSWSALIAGYVQKGQGKEALGCFQRMQSEGLSPNAITYSCILKACGIVQDIDKGKEIHEEIASQGLLKKDIVLGNALVDMYAKCGFLAKAQEVLDELPVWDEVSWNGLIARYTEQGKGEEALGCFHQMRSEGFSPDVITYACILRACGITQEIDMAERMHGEIISRGLLEKDVLLGNALVDMYAKCGVCTKAQKVFDDLPVRNVVSWNTVIAGYVQQGQGQLALGCLHKMQSEGFSPNAITYATILKACSITQDVDLGRQIHEEIASQGLLQNDVVLGNALIDMYAKCGVLAKAKEALDGLPVRNEVSWNALIAGYAQQGQGQEILVCFERMQSEGFSPDVVSWNGLIGGYSQQGLVKEALDYFQEMQKEGISPDAVTFLNVLKVCSLSGLEDEGQMYFDSMREKYGIAPGKEHYTCMVELFGRTRDFDKAMQVIEMMPSSDYPPIWSALLGACKKWGNVRFGQLAFERAVQLDRCDAAAYVSMIDIYASAGMLQEAQTIERMRMKNAAWR